MCSNRIKQYIDKLVNEAEVIGRFAIKDKNEFVKKYVSNEWKRFIEHELTTKNPDQLLEDYIEYFKSIQLPTHTIKKDELFYRARLGYNRLIGSDDDHNREFIVPYYGKDIQAPPPLFSTGGRFNREGTSYLYLSDTVETCLAEIHLQVGQICSVGKFKSTKTIELIDLTNIENDLKISLWANIFTEPISSDKKNRYNITRFLAEVLKHINKYGIYFESIQSKGNNIVCFQPDIFKSVQFSEKTYIAQKIAYEFEEFNDAIKEFSERQYYSSLTPINDDEEEEQANKFN